MSDKNNKSDKNNQNDENNQNDDKNNQSESENKINSDILGNYLEKNYIFKNPIQYNTNTRIIDENIIHTLEIINSIDKNEIPIYENIFLTNNYPAKLSMKQMSKYYTTDTHYLEQTQQIIKDIDNNKIIRDNNIDLTLKHYEEIKKETGFHEKYFYFDFNFAKQFNKNPIAIY